MFNGHQDTYHTPWLPEKQEKESKVQFATRLDTRMGATETKWSCPYFAGETWFTSAWLAFSTVATDQFGFTSEYDGSTFAFSLTSPLSSRLVLAQDSMLDLTRLLRGLPRTEDDPDDQVLIAHSWTECRSLVYKHVQASLGGMTQKGKRLMQRGLRRMQQTIKRRACQEFATKSSKLLYVLENNGAGFDILVHYVPHELHRYLAYILFRVQSTK